MISNNIYERFAEAILELEPNLQMSKDEVIAVVKMHGLEHFCRKLTDDAKEFIKVIELIKQLEEPEGDDYE